MAYAPSVSPSFLTTACRPSKGGGSSSAAWSSVRYTESIQTTSKHVVNTDQKTLTRAPKTCSHLFCFFSCWITALIFACRRPTKEGKVKYYQYITNEDQHIFLSWFKWLIPRHRAYKVHLPFPLPLLFENLLHQQLLVPSCLLGGADSL